MPIYYLRQLTGNRRTAHANRHLGRALAFVGGAANAGGFLAVKQYTSHMTGVLSSMADNLVVGQYGLVFAAVGALAAFVSGSAYSEILMSWGRHHRTHSEYAYPLLWEALLLLCFGLLGGYFEISIKAGFVPLTVLLLCFIMGLQNAIISKVSNAEIRTTHMTGIITDIGSELGKMVYINSSKETDRYKPVRANFKRLKILIGLLLSFSLGGLAGALGFKYVGYISTVPLAVILVLLAIVPLVDDVRARKRMLVRALHRSRFGQGQG